CYVYHDIFRRLGIADRRRPDHNRRLSCRTERTKPPMGSASSNDAIRNITDFSASVRSAASTAHRKATDEFGSLTFNEETQRARLPKEVFRALRRATAHGESIDPSVADIVASALKDWAVEHGATHYTHWFQPMTGITAEKHD